MLVVIDPEAFVIHSGRIEPLWLNADYIIMLTGIIINPGTV
jgi:hypothetical protein